ncbi:hypothetical protein P691DRAFT_622124, partial [Macrolepiota fuliginosa MF-IS2]
TFIDALNGGRDGINILSEIQGKYAQDSFFRDIMENPKEFKNFSVRNELIYLKENDAECLCVPKVLVNGRNIHEVLIHEAHSLLAHLGPHKTLGKLSCWWKDMAKDVMAFCESC